jgi:hypothetical protein
VQSTNALFFELTAQNPFSSKIRLSIFLKTKKQVSASASAETRRDQQGDLGSDFTAAWACWL